MEKKKVTAVRRNLNLAAKKADVSDSCDIFWLLENVSDLDRMIRFGYESAKRHDVI